MSEGARAWLIVIVVGAAIVALIVEVTGDTDEGPTAGPAAPPLEAVTGGPTPQAASVPTTSIGIPPPVVYEGTGARILRVAVPKFEEAAIATLNHVGGGNFAVWELDDNLARVDLLVNRRGNYTGTVMVDQAGGDFAMPLEIKSTGRWRVEIKPLDAAPTFDSQIVGTGDDVVSYTGDGQAMALSHPGPGNFTVRFDGSQGMKVLANEVGPYHATVSMSVGPAWVVVTADGAWSIAPA